MSSTTRRSTRPLSEAARHVIIPTDIVATGWPAVEARIREFGDQFDEWQRGVGRLVLAKRADGAYAATVGGITLSIPRQVAKTFMIGRIVVALCTIFPDLTVLWTAHRTRTASKTFDGLRGLAKRPAVAEHVESIRQANGEQEIRFGNGSVIMFGAREQGFGRGFEEVDIVVFDEAQILTEKALEDMVATTNQSRHPAGALLFFMGTPPRPVDPGEAFKARRAEALSGESADAVYIECSADDDADPDDREQWAKANPSFPHRTPVRSMLRLRKNLPSVDSWRREALGIWDPELAHDATISASQWRRLADSARPEGRRVFGVKFSVDGARVGLAGAVRPGDGPILIGGIRLASTAEGLDWLVEFLADRKDEISQIVIDGKAGVDPLVAALAERGIRARAKAPRASGRMIRVPTMAEYISAHAMFLQDVIGEQLFHDDAPDLNLQVAGARKRPIGTQGGWGWRGLTDDHDTTLLDAATLAFWGAKTTTRRAGRRQRIEVA